MIGLAATLTGWMALVAARAAVHVVFDPLMLLIGRALGMAICASKHRVVRRIGVAGRADAIRPSVSSREVSMVKCGSQPRTRGMTRLAGGGKPRRDMVRIGRGLILRLMTRITIS